jgi:hypothetical protein
MRISSVLDDAPVCSVWLCLSTRASLMIFWDFGGLALALPTRCDKDEKLTSERDDDDEDDPRAISCVSPSHPRGKGPPSQPIKQADWKFGTFSSLPQLHFVTSRNDHWWCPLAHPPCMRTTDQPMADAMLGRREHCVWAVGRPASVRGYFFNFLTTAAYGRRQQPL